MGFRFRKSIRIASGVRLNLSKSGISTSIGRPGATINLSSRGTRHTVGVPGTGLSFSSFTSKGRQSEAPPSTPRARGTGCGWIFAAVALVLLLARCSQPGDLSPDRAASEAITTVDGKQMRREDPAGAAAAFAGDATAYVTATAGLNGRSAPTTNGRVVRQFSHGDRVRVVDRSGEWLKVATAAGTMAWIASRHVAASPAARPQALLSRPHRRAARKPHRRRDYEGAACPCSGSQVCIGPRGGRYCITSGGNMRYGV